MDIFSILASLIVKHEIQNASNMDRDMERLQTIESRWADEERERERSNRILRVQKYLRGTPLANHSEALVDCAVDNSFHYGFLVGITRAESSLGKHYTLRNNPWNWGIHAGVTFDSIRDGACAVARGIRKSYDTSSILSIARKYAPKEDRNNPTHWAEVVEKTIYELDK